MTWTGDDRKTFIGASEAAAACGVSTYRTPLDVYREKTEGSDFEGNFATKCGTLMEPVIIELYRDSYPDLLVQANVTQATLTHDDHEFIRATIDADARPTDGTDDIWIVECKAFNPMRKSEFGEDGSEDIPIDCMFQVQQQMSVLDVDRCDLAVLFGVNDFHIYQIGRDDSIINGHEDEDGNWIPGIIEIECKLWKCIQEKRPPMVDPNHKEAVASLKKFYRQVEGEPIELDVLAGVVSDELVRLKEKKKAIEKDIAVRTADILQQIGDAPIGLLQDGSSFKRTVVAAKLGTLGDVDKARENVGKQVRAQSVRLTYREGK